MGVCSLRVLQEEMGLIDGRQRDGISLGHQYISYFQIESALLEYPGVVEAGAVADCVDQKDPAAGQFLKIFLALDENGQENSDYLALSERVTEYLRQKFAFMGPILVRVRDKLPMTRSGKISRSVLKEWN